MGISRKTLIALAAVLAVVLVPHLGVLLAFTVDVAVALASTVAFAVALGPHTIAMIAVTVAAATVLVLAQRIDAMTMRTGWSLVPTGRAALR